MAEEMRYLKISFKQPTAAWAAAAGVTTTVLPLPVLPTAKKVPRVPTLNQDDELPRNTLGKQLIKEKMTMYGRGLDIICRCRFSA